MRTNRQPNTLDQLRRYQRLLTLGGGWLVTAVVMLAFALDTISTVRTYIVTERQVFVANHGLVTREFEESEFTLRNAIIKTEISSQKRPAVNPALIAQFRAGGDELVFQPSALSRPQWVLGALDSPPDDATVARFFALATQLADANATNSVLRGRPVNGYFYDATQNIASIIPAPSKSGAEGAGAFANRRDLMTALFAGVGEDVLETAAD
jgi:two-component system, NarL family, capsular synthesis sensor histidine kinase RcsC